MRLLSMLLALLALLPFARAEAPRVAKVIKVLPHYLDLQGRHALSPSLFERDAYQAQLRRNPKARSGLRFDVQWRGYVDKPLVLRVEVRGLRGSDPTQARLEQAVAHRGLLGKWTSLTLKSEAYQQLGELSAWRVTLWDGDQLVSEKQSFLWQ